MSSGKNRTWKAIRRALLCGSAEDVYAEKTAVIIGSPKDFRHFDNSANETITCERSQSTRILRTKATLVTISTPSRHPAERHLSQSPLSFHPPNRRDFGCNRNSAFIPFIENSPTKDSDRESTPSAASSQQHLLAPRADPPRMRPLITRADSANSFSQPRPTHYDRERHVTPPAVIISNPMESPSRSGLPRHVRKRSSSAGPPLRPIHPALRQAVSNSNLHHPSMDSDAMYTRAYDSYTPSPRKPAATSFLAPIESRSPRELHRLTLGLGPSGSPSFVDAQSLFGDLSKSTSQQGAEKDEEDVFVVKAGRADAGRVDESRDVSRVYRKGSAADMLRAAQMGLKRDVPRTPQMEGVGLGLTWGSSP